MCKRKNLIITSGRVHLLTQFDSTNVYTPAVGDRDMRREGRVKLII